MKPKSKISRWALLAVGFFLVLTNLISVYSVFMPGKSSAADAGIPIAYDAPSVMCKPTLSLVPASNSQTAANTKLGNIMSVTGNGTWPAFGTTGYNTTGSQAETQTWQDVQQAKASVLMITFSSVDNGSTNNQACDTSMVLFRTLYGIDSSSANTFYGIWSCVSHTTLGKSGPNCRQGQGSSLGQRSGFRLVTATVAGPVGSSILAVNWPGPNDVPGFISSEVNLNDPNHIVGSAPFTGGGSTNTSQSLPDCINQYKDDKNALQKNCFDHWIGEFTDIGTISLAGEQWKMTGWGGDNITYNLVQTDKNAALQGLGVALVIPTNHSESDLNIDEPGNAADLQQFGTAISHNYTINARFNTSGEDGNIDIQTNGAPSTSLNAGINQIGTVYVDSTGQGIIQLALTNPGDNEKPYYGQYSNSNTSSPTTYQIVGGGFSGCGSTQPQIILDTPITAAMQDGQHAVTAKWLMTYTNSVCANVSIPVTLAVAKADATAPGGNTDCATGKDSQGNCKNETDDTLNCGSGAFSWIFCTGITILEGAASRLDSFIMDQLNVPTNNIFGTSNDNSKAYQGAWNSFRLLAIGLLVIVGLIMVVSQALGMEILDAYTIRKILPRLLIAIIGISLSWPLLQFVINLFNVIGLDIRGLIYSPFVNLANGGSKSALIALGNPLTLVAAGTTLFVIYGPAVFTFLLTGFLALLVAFLILVIRQLAIIILVILAPIAIACYILPNTQKAWKMWLDNFLGLMLMFPIISALIAAGHVMSAVGRGPGASPMEQFVAIVAYFVPYFMLPFAFRLATGAIGTLAGMVNDRSKGAFDRLKKYRSGKAAENVHAMKEGKRFSERNALTRGFNRTTVGAGTGWKGRFGMGARGQEAVDIARRNAAASSVMKDPAWAQIQENDDALHALTHNGPAQARDALMKRWNNDAARVDRAIAAAQTSVGFGRPQAIAAAQQLAATGTGYDNMADQARTIARASGGNTSTAAAIAGFNNFISKQKGRHDLAPGAGALIGMSQRAMGPQTSSYDVEIESKAETGAAWNSGSLYQLANGKKAATKNFTEHWERQYQEALAMPAGREREDQLQAALIARNEFEAMLPNASGDNQVVINEFLQKTKKMTSDWGAANPAQTATYDRIADQARRRARVYQREDPNRQGQQGS